MLVFKYCVALYLFMYFTNKNKIKFKKTILKQTRLDLDPHCLTVTLIVFLKDYKEIILKKKSADNKETSGLQLRVCKENLIFLFLNH